jgi:hypothetical protein
VAMAGFCSHVHQLWVHDKRDSSDPKKLQVKRSKKPIALHVFIHSDSVISHGLCFFHVRHAVELYINCRNWYHVVYPDIPEDEIFKINYPLRDMYDSKKM